MTGDTNGYKWGYKDLASYMTESNLDVNAWADLAVSAGAKYVVPVGLFHDAFAIYESKYTSWNSVKLGPKRDHITQLASAVRARGLKFGISNHFFENWGWFHHTSQYDTGDPQNYALYNVPESETTTPSLTHRTNWLNRAQEMVDKWHPDLIGFASAYGSKTRTRVLSSIFSIMLVRPAMIRVPAWLMPGLKS